LRQALFEVGASFLMAQRLAALDLCQTFVLFVQEPVVVVDQPFDRFLCQRLRVHSALVRDAGQLGLHVWRKGHFHSASVPDVCAESSGLTMVTF
jgi:hypothetical protein